MQVLIEKPQPCTGAPWKARLNLHRSKDAVFILLLLRCLHNTLLPITHRRRGINSNISRSLHIVKPDLHIVRLIILRRLLIRLHLVIGDDPCRRHPDRRHWRRHPRRRYHRRHNLIRLDRNQHNLSRILQGPHLPLSPTRHKITDAQQPDHRPCRRHRFLNPSIVRLTQLIRTIILVPPFKKDIQDIRVFDLIWFHKKEFTIRCPSRPIP